MTSVDTVGVDPDVGKGVASNVGPGVGTKVVGPEVVGEGVVGSDVVGSGVGAAVVGAGVVGAVDGLLVVKGTVGDNVSFGVPNSAGLLLQMVGAGLLVTVLDGAGLGDLVSVGLGVAGRGLLTLSLARLRRTPPGVHLLILLLVPMHPSEMTSAFDPDSAVVPSPLMKPCLNKPEAW